ncbi:zinc finger protein 592 [Spea bombifrons]|uniref:zinc finger protein 592 n=1 Tax=Spea bombifrons TaxID=233779 RepID=UPI00234ABA58|nr:zinc finger protein 592 [Spea bombifrons]
MGDMKTPDFDDLLAAFDIPDATSLDPKEAIQSTSDEPENHLKPPGMCLDENLSLSQPVPAPDVPAVSVIVKNTSRQESFEATEKEGNHMGSTLLQNGFRSPEVGPEPHTVGQGYVKFEPGFINGDNSRGYVDKLESHKPEPLPTFNQFSPISSPEPEDTSKDNGVLSKQKVSESPYFPQPTMYVPVESCVVDSIRKPAETELSMFDEYCKKEQKPDCKELEKERSAEQRRETEKANSLLGESMSFKEENDISEEKVFSESTVCSSAVPPRQRIKPANSKLSSCVAALVALQAKKVAMVPKEEPSSVTKEAVVPLKDSVKGSPKMPKSPKSPRSPLEVVKKILKPPDSPMSICSDTSSKGSPSVCAGSPPAIPKVRIKTIKTSSGEIKRTVTRILPEVETDDMVKSPDDFQAENSSSEDIKGCVPLEDTTDFEKEKVRNPGKTAAPTSSQVPGVTSSQVVNAKADKKKGATTSNLNPSSGSAKTSNSSQNKKQAPPTTKTTSNPTTQLPKAVHLASLNLVPNSITTPVAAKATSARQTQGQVAPMTVPLVHQVKISAPVIVEAFNKLLHSTNPVPTYTPNLNPPPECDIHLPATGFTCLECGDSFALEKSLAQHHSRRSIHIEVMCSQCSKTVQFYNKCSLLSHAREHKTKGLIMQCSQLMMKPISSEQMLAPSPVALALAAQPLPATQRTVSSTVPPGVGSGTSSYASPAMPLYADPYGLIRHGFKCLECGKQVDDYTCLAGHYQRVAEDKDGLTCQVCQMMLPNKCSYGAHQRTHTHKSPYCCPECGVLCRSAYFQTHVKENCLHYTRKVAFRCIHCGLVFMSLGLLKGHIQDKHCEVFHKCSFCPMAFKSTENTAAHITAQHPTATHTNAQIIYKCSCETVFNKKRLLHQHFYQNTNTLLVNVFKCPECQLAYMQKQLLIQHLKSVHGLPKIPDETAGVQKKSDTAREKNDSTSAKAGSKGDGASSSKKDTDSSQSQQKLKLSGWTCGECSEWILDRETYVFHMKKSHGKCMKRYPCRQCERSFNSCTSLRRHVRNNHDTKKDYTCCYCTEKPKFAKPSLLANHIILMHGIKNPELTQVTKGALVPSNTSAQSSDKEQITGVKRTATEALEDSQGKKLKTLYKCAKCSFTANNNTEFLEHIPQHKTDNSTYQCVHCGLCYTSQISLNRHLFIVHKVKEEEDEEEDTDQRQVNPAPEAPQPSSIKQDHGGSWECVRCNLTFDLESAHAAHLRTHDDIPSSCVKQESQ